MLNLRRSREFSQESTALRIVEMREKGYYSVRTGKHPGGAKLDLPSLKRIFLSLDRQFNERGYFQEAFGYECVDDGSVYGSLGEDIAGAILIAIRKDNLWPLRQRMPNYSEDDVFDMIEFLYDHVSKPIDGRFHSYSGCGMHYSTFDRAKGQAEYRTELNPILACYEDGYELSERGEILALPEPGMAALVGATLPQLDPHNVEERVQAGVTRFHRHRSSLDDRKHAIRDLADVLEYLRPKLKTVLKSRDEADLFNLANNFGIRHHNPEQKTNYTSAIWYSWMFYYYLATIHACVRLLDQTGRK